MSINMTIGLSFECETTAKAAERLTDLGAALAALGYSAAQEVVLIRINGKRFAFKGGIVVPLEAGDSG